MILSMQESLRHAFRPEMLSAQITIQDILSQLFQASLIPVIRRGCLKNDPVQDNESDTYLINSLGNKDLADFVTEVVQRISVTQSVISIDDVEIAKELNKELPDSIESDNERVISIRNGLSNILRNIGALELIIYPYKSSPEKIVLQESLLELANHFPEFSWIEDEIRQMPDGVDDTEEKDGFNGLALMHLPPAEIMTSQPAGLTTLQREFLTAIQNWHIGEMSRVEKRAKRLRWLARILLVGLGLVLIAAVVFALYSIQSTMVASSNASLAATNAVMAGQVAQIAATDVVAANTARIISTQSIATAQVAATSVVQLNADELAAQAISLIDQQMDLALLLGVEAYNRLNTSKTRNALFTALTFQPAIERLVSGHSGGILDIAFSADGKRMATGGTDHTVILYENIDDLNLTHQLRGHKDAIYSVAFSPDGAVLASGSKDGTIRLWDTSSGEQILFPLTGHGGAVYSISFSSDGKMLVSGGEDKTIRLWDITTGKPLGKPKGGHTQIVTSVSFSPDGKYFVSAGLDANVIVWDAKTGALYGKVLTKGLGPVWSIAFSQDGRVLAVGGADNSIHLWDMQRWKESGKPLLGHTGSVLSLAFGKEGKVLASGGDDGILFWSIDTDASGTVVGASMGEAIQAHNGPIHGLAIHPTNKWLATGNSSDRETILWNLPALLHTGISGGKEILGHTETVSSLAFSPDGKLLATGSWDKTINIWDMTQQDTTKVDPVFITSLQGHQGYVMGIAFSPKGNLLASASVDNTLRLWDMNTFSPVGEPLLGHTGWVRSIAFHSDGKVFASSSWDKTIRLWDSSTTLPIHAPLQEEAVVYALAFHPDGRWLLSGGEATPNTISVWESNDFLTSQPQQYLTFGPERAVYSIAVSPDGQTLAAGGADKSISLWDIKTGQEILPPLQAHSGDVLSLAFSPDGAYLASGSSDTQIILWDMQAKLPIGKPLKGHQDFVYALSFHPEGKILASGGADKKVFLWDVSVPSWQERACRKAGRNLSTAEWNKYMGNSPYHKTCPDNP